MGMSVRLFFVMERQISRIMAENNLRGLAVGTATMSGEAAQQVHQTLVAEQGEVYIVTRDAIVEGDAGAVEQLKALF